MQCILREKLLAHAMKLSGVSEIYRTESHRFVEVYYQWLDETEKDLSVLRSPIVILLQAEKSSLTSVLDGYLPENIQPGKGTRKNQKAIAAQSIGKISSEMYSKIEDIDSMFNQLSEKMCHTIAVLASKEPDLYKNIHNNQYGVYAILGMIRNTPETLPMYNYFCAKLSSVDIHYLLEDILQKIAGNYTDTP